MERGRQRRHSPRPLVFREQRPADAETGPARGLFPILSLRTCKADVVVGLPEGVAEKLDADEKEKGWRINGKYVLVHYLRCFTYVAVTIIGRYALITFEPRS